MFRTAVRRLSQCPCKKDNVRVSVLGGDTAIGTAMIFQLKVWSVVSEIKIHGSSPIIRDIADDLNQIPTGTRVVPFSGPNQLKQTLARADVVMVYNETGCLKQDISDDTLFHMNAPVMEKVAKTCVSVCPEAVFALLTPPLNSTVPLFAQVLRENGVLKAGKLVGIVSDMTMTARKLVATTLGLSPKAIWIPITGGASPSTLVPIVTGARPGGVFLAKESKKISEKVRSVREDIRKANEDEPGSIAAGYAVADFIRAICKGLMGKETDAHPALVRTRVVDGIDYLVLPVHFGPGGVSETHGIPDMNRQDLKLMDSAVREMAAELARARDFMSKKRTSCVACDSPSVPAYSPACAV